MLEETTARPVVIEANTMTDMAKCSYAPAIEGYASLLLKMQCLKRAWIQLSPVHMKLAS